MPAIGFMIHARARMHEKCCHVWRVEMQGKFEGAVVKVREKRRLNRIM